MNQKGQTAGISQEKKKTLFQGGVSQQWAQAQEVAGRKGNAKKNSKNYHRKIRMDIGRGGSTKVTFPIPCPKPQSVKI